MHPPQKSPSRQVSLIGAGINSIAGIRQATRSDCPATTETGNALMYPSALSDKSLLGIDRLTTCAPATKTSLTSVQLDRRRPAATKRVYEHGLPWCWERAMPLQWISSWRGV